MTGTLGRRGLLLFAHGARDPRWAQPFEAVARRARLSQPGWQVELAFLEFMPPGLRQAGDSMAAGGCTEVDVVPLFLGTGGHVRKDLPLLLAALAAAHPAVRWRLRRAIGEVASVSDAIADAALALANSDADAGTAAAGPTEPTRAHQ